MKKIAFKIMMFLLILFIFIWGISIIKCEVLTYRYGNCFETTYKENTMIGEVEIFKVLNISDSYARVYYVSEGYTSGDVLIFVKTDDEWAYDSWEKTVWSKHGSASGVIWPYWWHSIHRGF